MQQYDYDVVIIGGGMVGASLACSLAPSQLKILIIESFPLPNNAQEIKYQPSFDARATALSYGSAELYQQIGLWDELKTCATPIHKIHVSDRGNPITTTMDREQHKLDALGYVIENHWLGNNLLKHLQQFENITWHSPATVTQLIPQEKSIDIHIEQNGTVSIVKSELSIIADGANSALREKLGIHAHINPYQQTAIIANVAFENDHEYVAYERFTDEGPLALLPLNEKRSINDSGTSKRSALVWTIPTDQANDISTLSDNDFLQQLQKRFGYRLGLFTQVGQRYAYPLELIVAEEQVRSNLVVMGNAAHSLHPVAGQGFNLALRDIARLSNIITNAKKENRPLGDLQLLKQYEKEQLSDQNLIINFSDAVTRLFSNANIASRTARNLGMLALDILPGTKPLFTRKAMGL